MPGIAIFYSLRLGHILNGNIRWDLIWESCTECLGVAQSNHMSPQKLKKVGGEKQTSKFISDFEDGDKDYIQSNMEASKARKYLDFILNSKKQPHLLT